MSAWQPIETAPKDGSSVLLFTTSADDSDMTEYLEAVGEIELPLIRIQIGWWSGKEWELQIIGNPTHWMPLPKPPGGGERQEAVRCFMDGIDWEYHLANDAKGTLLFPTERSLRAEKTCLSGGCGVVEVAVSLIRWVEPQDLKFDEGRE